MVTAWTAQVEPELTDEMNSAAMKCAKVQEFLHRIQSEANGPDPSPVNEIIVCHRYDGYTGLVLGHPAR